MEFRQKTDLQITGSTIHNTSGGGSGESVSNPGQGLDGGSSQQGQETESKKGLKVGNALRIETSTIVIDSAGDKLWYPPTCLQGVEDVPEGEAGYPDLK
ncbi:MAG: hypothetical protein JXA19_03840 [Anaerolineales bacterium]|nr:hypothetical protein [Anaerolineales bacterium]